MRSNNWKICGLVAMAIFSSLLFVSCSSFNINNKPQVGKNNPEKGRIYTISKIVPVRALPVEKHVFSGGVLKLAKLDSSQPDSVYSPQLASMSMGRPNSGFLFNAVQMPSSDYWKIVNPAESWGTEETIKFIIRSVKKVNKQFSNTPKIYIGDISKKGGGKFGQHVSHQSGRDVDLSWYYKSNDNGWWNRGRKDNFDLSRNWALVKSIVAQTNVELILIGKSVQELLYNYALTRGEDRDWLNSIFQYPYGTQRAIIRHAEGHATHMHVRFHNLKVQTLESQTNSDRKIIVYQ